MLKAEQLQEMAKGAADHSRKCMDHGDLHLAELSLNTCAIYTIGAELIGRLDNLHFEFEMHEPGSHYRFNGSGKLYIKGGKELDNSSKSKDSSASQEGVQATGSTKGECREGSSST